MESQHTPKLHHCAYPVTFKNQGKLTVAFAGQMLVLLLLLITHDYGSDQFTSLANGGQPSRHNVILDGPGLIGLTFFRTKKILQLNGFHYDPDGGTVPISADVNSIWFVNSRGTQAWIENRNDGKTLGIGIDWEMDDTFNYSENEYSLALGRINVDTHRAPDTKYPARWIWNNLNGHKIEAMIEDGKIWQIQLH